MTRPLSCAPGVENCLRTLETLLPRGTAGARFFAEKWLEEDADALARLSLSPDKSEIILRLTIDTAMSSVMDYFEIFLTRMVMSRKAAEKLGLRFRLIINDQSVL